MIQEMRISSKIIVFHLLLKLPTRMFLIHVQGIGVNIEFENFVSSNSFFTVTEGWKYFIPQLSHVTTLQTDRIFRYVPADKRYVFIFA